MAGRGRSAARFRPAVGAVAHSAPSRRQAALLVVGLLVLASAVTAASFLVKPSKARAFNLFYGSMFLNNDAAPVAIDLASAKPTVRLLAANTQVNAVNNSKLRVVPLAEGTLLLNTTTGEFNMVDNTGFVIKHSGGGVPLPEQSDSTAAVGVAAGTMAYIVQTGKAHTAVYLVSAATVSSASGQRADVKPRAFATMDTGSSTAAGANVSANTDLWMLVGSGASRTIRQLHLPQGSNAGVALTRTDHGTVSGAAAIGAATRAADGSGGDVVAVAGRDAVRVFDGSGTPRNLPVRGLGGVDRIIAATNQHGVLSFLYHSADGWSLVRARVGQDAVTVHDLDGIPSDVTLAPPAQSNGALYTMDTGHAGTIWRISASGAVGTVKGAASYPIAESSSGERVEAAPFSNAYVVGRGDRIILNSPSHTNAIAIFTDGSHAPVVIDKSTAVDLNAAGGAAEITDKHQAKTPTQQPTTAPPTASPKPAQPVNNHIDCKTAAQVPHIPEVHLVQRGSRSVQLAWTYPVLDSQDCIPSTYTVSVKRISASGPQAPSAVTVQGQNGVNLTGLFPKTEYELVVTAYINGTGTPSAPLRVTTSAEGPPAPTNVHTTVDDAGNWTITWNSCGGRDDNCVPSANWTIIPAFCDGTGLSSPPAPVTIIGDPTQHSFSYTFHGNAGLLGRGLSFQVEGVGTTGMIGTPAKDGQCSYSWAHPNPASMSLTGGLADKSVANGATTSATVTLHFDGDRNVATGGVGAKFTYQLLLGGNVVQTKDATTATTATFDGIEPGKDYSAQVSVAPPRHDDAAVTVGPVSIGHTISDWPQITVAASFANTDDVSGTLSVSIDGVSSSGSDGEMFTLSDSALICGSSSYPLTKSSFDPAATKTTPLTFSGIQRSDYNGACTVTVHLQESATSGTLLYGGTESPKSTGGGVSIDQPTLNAKFTASWDKDKANTVDVAYSGTPSTIVWAHDWKMTLSDPSGNACGTATDGPSATISSTCKSVQDDKGWKVAVSFVYFGQTESFTTTVGGAQAWPTVSGDDFDLSWNGKSGGQYQIKIAYHGPANLGPGDWKEAASTPQHADCNSIAWAPAPATSENLPVDTTCTQFSDVPVTVTITNSKNPNQDPISITLTGDTPTNLTCDPSGVGATWGTTGGDNPKPIVDISAGDQSKLGGCSDWELTLQEKHGLLGGWNDCGSATGASTLPATIAPSCAPGADWRYQVVISYTDNTKTPRNQPQPFTVDVDGKPS